MSKPVVTRLRYVASENPDSITEFLGALGFRVQIYGAPQWDGERWLCWFVPPDDSGIKIGNVELD